MAEEDAPLDAGPFTVWVRSTQAVLRGERDADVPCGGCTACCTSSQFVHVDPDERDTLASIPAELLAPAPGRPAGHMVLGFDARGHCPMLVDGACTIYDHRPRTCRMYDCRVHTAAGIELDPAGRQAAIARQVGRWRFTLETQEDARRLAAVRVTVDRLRDEIRRRPGPAPTPTQVAVRAVEVHDRALEADV